MSLQTELIDKIKKLPENQQMTICIVEITYLVEKGRLPLISRDHKIRASSVPTIW